MKNIKMIIVLIMICLFIPAKVNASNVRIKSVTIEDKSRNVSEKENASYENMTINLNLKLKEKDDYAKYKVEIENGDSKDYKLQLSNLTGDEYIEYSIDCDGEELVKANSTKIIHITAKYKKEIPENVLENGKYKSNQSLKVSLINNPKTSNNIIKLLILLVFIILSIILLIFIPKNKKLILPLIALLIPITIYALEELSLTINLNIEVIDTQVVYSFNRNEIYLGDSIDELDRYEEDIDEMDEDAFLEHTFKKDKLVKTRLCQRIKRNVICFDQDNVDEVEDIYNDIDADCYSDGSIRNGGYIYCYTNINNQEVDFRIKNEESYARVGSCSTQFEYCYYYVHDEYSYCEISRGCVK